MARADVCDMNSVGEEFDYIRPRCGRRWINQNDFTV